MEKKKGTINEALQRVSDNFQTIEIERGKINFNKKFFATCAGIGVVSAGIGVGCIIVAGLAVAPVAAIGFGTAAGVTSGIFIKKQNDYSKELDDAFLKNDEALQNIYMKKYK